MGCSNEPRNINSTSKLKPQNANLIKPPNLYYVNLTHPDCKIQLDSAKQDVKNGKYTFIDPMGIASIRYEDEITELLSNYKIEYRLKGPNCTNEQECYGYYMDSIINLKFGTEFIKSIRRESDNLFLSRWETKEYMYWNIDEIPTNSEYPSQEFISENLMLPAGWDSIPMKYERQYLMIEVLITSDGELKEWSFDEMNNIKKTNQPFIPEIKIQIQDIISQMTNWNPGRLSNKHVNCKLLLDVNLDFK